MKLVKLGLLCALAAAAVWGQATAQLHGVVQDMSGAALPGATVKATQTETGISRTVTAEADGGYVITNLPLGPYTIEVSKEGFSSVVQMGVVLQVGSDPALPIAMKVGAVTERVEVEANASQVETTNVGVGSVIENQRVLELPLNGRKPQDLIALGGAAVQTGASPTYGMATGYKIAVAGGMPDGVQYTLDGANHNNFFDGTSMILPFPEALQEFKISTSTQDASNAGRAGATVSAVMKSGTNSFHGDAFWFLRNYDLNARDFFAKAKDGLKRNQAGGVIGGPIKKDKLFFFLGYQGTFVRQTPISQVTFVPTQDMLNGNFTAYAGQCNGGKTLKAPFGTNGFAANTIDPALFDPAAVKIAALLPKAIDACGSTFFANPLHDNVHEGDARVDYQVSDKQSLFLRNMLVKDLIAVPYSIDPSNILVAGGVGHNDQFDGFTIGDTYLLSGTKVNSVRLFLNRIAAIIQGPNMFNQAAGANTYANVGINAYTYQPNYLTIPVSGGFSLGNGNFSQNSFAYTTGFGLNEDFRWVHGSHQFAFGGFMNRSIEWSVAQAWSGGSYSIGNAYTGLGLSDFMLGVVSQLRQANPNPLNLAQNFVGLYAQDTWKINQKLTLNYGVNWDPFLGMAFQQGDLYNFSLPNFYSGTTSKAVAGAPAGFTFPGDAGFPGKSGINSQYGQFDPRIGLAWDPFGDGKTAIRIGAGLAHDFIEQDLHLNTSSSLPFRLTVITAPNQPYTLSNPWGSSDPFPYNFNPKNPVWPTTAQFPCLSSTCPPGFLPVPSNMHTHLEQSWNLGIQRQVTNNLFVSATYAGNHILHVWSAAELNPATYVSGTCAAGTLGLTVSGPCTGTTNANITARRVLNLANPTAPPLGYITQYDDGGTQYYHGLLLNANYRLRSGLSISGNYTWSHCIGLAALQGVLNPGANYVHSGWGSNITGANDRNADVGNCVQDRRQVANFTLVYQTPKFSNRGMRVVGSGWTVATAVQARTGQYVALVTGSLQDPNTGAGGNSPGTQRLNQVLPNVYAANQLSSCATATGCVQWLNTAAFAGNCPAAPAPPTTGCIPLGTSGDVGAYSVLGPGFWQWDMTLSRNFAITEGTHMEFRAEAFDVTNSMRPGNPGVNAGAPATFGLITTDATPPPGVTNPGGLAGSPTNAPARVMQFALKYVF